jgi:hypothetical protein
VHDHDGSRPREVPLVTARRTSRDRPARTATRTAAVAAAAAAAEAGQHQPPRIAETDRRLRVRAEVTTVGVAVAAAAAELHQLLGPPAPPLALRRDPLTATDHLSGATPGGTTPRVTALAVRAERGAIRTTRRGDTGPVRALAVAAAEAAVVAAAGVAEEADGKRAARLRTVRTRRGTGGK